MKFWNFCVQCTYDPSMTTFQAPLQGPSELGKRSLGTPRAHLEPLQGTRTPPPDPMIISWYIIMHIVLCIFTLGTLNLLFDIPIE